jgi:hypothetical protein
VKGTDPGQQKRPDEIEARLKLQSTLRRRFAVGLGMIIFSILLGLGGWGGGYRHNLGGNHRSAHDICWRVERDILDTEDPQSWSRLLIF